MQLFESPPDSVPVARTGEMCLRTGTWRTDDDDKQDIDIKAGAMFPECPFCGRVIGWLYIHE